MRNEYTYQLLDFIKNGIKLDDETTKKFDIVDYYQYFGRNIFELYNEYYSNNTMRSALKSFIIENLGNVCFGGSNIKKSFLNARNVQLYLDTKIILNVSFDEKGNYIEGSGYTISDEEKQEAYEFLEIYNGVVTEKGLETIFKRIANGYPLYEKVWGRRR